MSSTSSLANLLAVLMGSRLPYWTQQADGATSSEYDRPPSSSTSGVSLVAPDNKGTLKARARIKVRREAHRRRVDVTVTADASTTYTLTVNGTAITATTGEATVDGVLVDIAANVTADATVGGGAALPKVEAVLLDSAGAVTVGTAGGGNAAATLVLYGVVNSGNLLGDFYFDASETGGTGTATIVADAASATAQVWRGTPLAATTGASVSGWLLDPNAAAVAVTLRGWDKLLDTPGVSRLYVELSAVAGHASDGSGTGDVTISYRVGGIEIGPSILETESS